ncbi:MAG: Mrp/NBP35 family ATP-binding protein [Bdellovibrionales bacterium]|nr:Mrp/NBP35 family ATP-binding protein [Bdellovibrionales bacterium]
MNQANPFNPQPLPGIKNIILVGSGKGGVGKSTVSVNLALALKNKGKKVGLLDADIYGPSIPRMVGCLNQAPGINEDKKLLPIQRYGLSVMSIGFLVDESQAMVWRGPMLFKAMDQFFHDVKWGDLDYLILDLPPGTGDIALTIAQKLKVAGGIIVTTPQNISLADAKKAVDMFNQVHIPQLGFVENMSYFKAPGSEEKIQLFPKGELDAYLDAKQIKKLAEIPFNPNVSLGSEAGIPIVESQHDSTESLAFSSVAEKLIEKLG